MAVLVFGFVLLVVGIFMRVGAVAVGADSARPAAGALRRKSTRRS